MTDAVLSATADHARAVALVARHGWNATSPQVLAPGYRYWHAEHGCVAYADTGRAWVAAGTPIAPADHLADLAARFVAGARPRRRRALFFGTEGRFTELLPWRHVPVAEQPEWDPAAWPDTLRAHKSLREQLRRARAKGVTVRTLTATDVAGDRALTVAIAATRDAWLRSRRMPPMGFLVDLPAIADVERMWIVAERHGAVIAAAAVAHVPARPGALVEHVLRRPDAPNGTTELIVDAAMRLAAARGDRWITLGMAPLAGRVAWPLRVARRLGRPLYDFDGLRAYRARLHPARWTPIHLSIPPRRSVALAVVDLLTVFARGSLVRYGLATGRRLLPGGR